MNYEFQLSGNNTFSYYNDYTIYRFMHYFQQIRYVLKLNPKKVLEIGPGDYTVTDFLRRKGITVKTFDNDKNLFQDYVGDIRNGLDVDEKFDLTLASEVFEHMNIEYLDKILEGIKKCLSNGGYLVVSLPYSTIRLFPKRSRYGKIISCEGRFFTFIPFYWIQPLYTFIRGLYRIIFKGKSRKEAFKCFSIPESSLEDSPKVHHWDLGFRPTTRKSIRKIMSNHLNIIEEKIYYNTNCVFYILRKCR